MSSAVPIRISQYGVIADASVAREQLENETGLVELAQELHREAVWACLRQMGSDAALPWRTILENLETARRQLFDRPRAPAPRQPMAMSDSNAMSLANLEALE